MCDADDTHEDYCRFRYVLCKNTGCNQKVQVVELLNHYKKYHETSFNVASVPTCVLKPFNADDAKLWFVTALVNEQIYYIYLNKSKQEQFWDILVETQFATKPKKEHFFNLTLENGEFVAMSTLTAVNNKGDFGYNLCDAIFETFEANRSLCMKVSQQLLHRLVDKDKSLKVSYSLFQK